MKLLLKDFKVFALEFRAKLTLFYAQSTWGSREERVQDVELVAYFNNFWGKKKSLADKCIDGCDTSSSSVCLYILPKQFAPNSRDFT